MLYIIAVVLIVLWLLGIVSSYTMNGFIHIPESHCCYRDSGAPYPWTEGDLKIIKSYALIKAHYNQ